MLALAAAASFALFDVLVQKWSASWGPGRFLPVLFGIAAVLSLGWIPLFPQAPARQLAAGASLGPARQLAEGASLGPIEPQSRSGPRLAPAADSSAGRDGKSAILWMLGGALFFSAQLLLLMLSVARDAVSVNIVYSLRSLWSVGLVWLIGHWFDNQERHMPTRLLIWRMAGAALMTAAIVLTVTRG